MKTELVTTPKRQATRVLADLRESGEPVLITEHGKPSAYWVDVDSYEFMQRQLQVLEGLSGRWSVRCGVPSRVSGGVRVGRQGRGASRRGRR